MPRSIKAVERRSPHHALLVRLQLRSEALVANNGAMLTRHELSSNHWGFSNRPKTLHGKLKEKILEPFGYALVDTKESLTPSGLLFSRTYTYAKDEDTFRIYAYAECDFHAEERVVYVDHFPDGVGGTNHSTLTIEDIIGAMSWGQVTPRGRSNMERVS